MWFEQALVFRMLRNENSNRYDYILKDVVFISDIKRLEEKRELFCRVERSYREIARRKKFPLWLYLCNEDRPREDELGEWKKDNRQKYEFYISKKRLELIKQGKHVDADSPRVLIRSISISLDTVL